MTNPMTMGPRAPMRPPTDSLPVDPDIDGPDTTTGWTNSRRHRRIPSASPRLHASVLAAIAAGGALGSCARYAVDLGLPTTRYDFPWSTFLVNSSGSFALSVLIVFVVDLWPPSRHVRPFWAIGFIGSFTTFSTACVETDLLFAHHFAVGVVYLSASVLAGLAAVSFGLWLGRAVTGAVHAHRAAEEV